MGAVIRLPVQKAAARESNKLALTEGRIDAIPLPRKGKAEYHYDTKEPGLAVRATSGGKSYVFYRWFHGKPGRITIGRVGELPLKRSREIAAGYRGDLAKGIDVFARERSAKTAARPVTVAEAYDLLVARPDMRRSTRRDYASLWKRVPSRLKTRALADVQPSELVKLHTDIGQKHRRTANKVVALLSVLFSRNGVRANNPAKEVRPFAEDPRQRILTLDELYSLRDALEAEAEPWRGFFLLLMLTGARRGALARMCWADLDLEGAVWRVPAVWSKNRKVLTVALAAEAVGVLKALFEVRGASEWVFPARSNAGHITEPIKAWNRIAKRAGVVGAKPHDLRRTLGTAVAADGGGAATIAAVLGHMSHASARSYVHLSAEMARGAVEKAAARSRRPANAPQD